MSLFTAITSSTRWLRLLIGSLPVGFLLGCQPEDLSVDDVPVAEERLVVSTAFIPDQSVSLVLTKTFSALAGDLSNNTDLLGEIVVRDADVSLTVRDTTVQLIEIIDGVYANVTIPSYPGEMYSIAIKDSSGLETSASTMMNRSVNFSYLEVQLEYTGFDSIPRIRFGFDDLPNGQNWYMVHVQTLEWQDNLLDLLINGGSYTYLVNDTEITDGDQVEDDFATLIDRDFRSGDTLLVTLAEINEDYYDYLERRNDRSLASDLLSEPYNLPSNTTNGYGFFNLLNPDYRLVVIDD